MAETSVQILFIGDQDATELGKRLVPAQEETGVEPRQEMIEHPQKEVKQNGKRRERLKFQDVFERFSRRSQNQFA